MHCGSVRLCQFDSFWIPFNATNRAVRAAEIALNAKLTFLGPYRHSRWERGVFAPIFLRLGLWQGYRVSSVVQQRADIIVRDSRCDIMQPSPSPFIKWTHICTNWLLLCTHNSLASCLCISACTSRGLLSVFNAPGLCMYVSTKGGVGGFQLKTTN